MYICLRPLSNVIRLEGNFDQEVSGNKSPLTIVIDKSLSCELVSIACVAPTCKIRIHNTYETCQLIEQATES